MLLEVNEIKHTLMVKCLDYICDQGHTPYLAVDATNPDYMGPMAEGETGLVLLSISASATRGFYMDEEGIQFNYSQGGTKANAFIPMEAVATIFAKEDHTMCQAFPYKKGVDLKPEAVKVAAKVTHKAPTKPVKKGWSPRVIKGGKS
jgi:stringent starvation protein B